MSRVVWLVATLAVTAAGGGGYWLGQDAVPLAPRLDRTSAVASAKRAGPVIYYRDPEGKPAYALTAKSTPDGRPYVPVQASDDVSFDDRDQAEISEPAASPPVGEKRILYYRNPMGLADSSPVPKKDSMGMDYLPVYAGEESDAGTVKISLGKMQRTGVRSEIVERQSVARPVRVPGTVQLDERRITVISTRSEAFVEKVEDITTGDLVRKGQPLVQVFSPDINTAAAQLIAAPGFEGSRRRLQNLNVSAEMISEIERSRKVPLTITWSSPRDGIVLERGAVEGMKAAAGDVLFRIGDVSVIWVLADVPEYALGDVHVGQSVTVRIRALPVKSFSGRIALIYPQVNKETRTTRVRIELPNPDGVLLPEMYADIEIATGSSAPVIAVPEDAVIDTGTRQLVLIDQGDGRFQPRDIERGARGDGYVEIRKGVQPGERVVTAANFLIDAESNLKAALQGLAPAASPPNGGQPQ